MLSSASSNLLWFALPLVLPSLAIQNITLTSSAIPSQPPADASQILDKALASISIEIAYTDLFTGSDNGTGMNTLTKELMQRLVERTGVGPDIRPGGITVDSSTYDADSTSSALVLDESASGGVYTTTIGPSFYDDILSVFPNSTKFVLDVNLANNTISFARDELQAGIEAFGWDRLRALELGNEPDHYAESSLRPAGWDSSDYTAQFIGWTSVLEQTLSNLSFPKNMWQANSFADDPTSSALMTTVDTVEEGIDVGKDVIGVFSQHMYQYSTCDTIRDAIATLPHLVNHTNITAYVDLWKPQIAAARNLGKEFAIGEFSSVSCSGKENVSDTFGQALWMADTILYSASVNISRMYAHQGATLVLQSSTQANSPGFSWYNLWYPTESDRFGAAQAGPSFVAYLLIAEAVGINSTSRLSYIPLPSAPDVGVYAIWESSYSTTESVQTVNERSSQGEEEEVLSRIVILNLGNRNVSSTTEEADEVAVDVDLSAFVSSGGGDVKVKRMTSPGMDSKTSNSTLWAGQEYSTGVANGEEIVETLNGTSVRVEGSEGIIVFLT